MGQSGDSPLDRYRQRKEAIDTAAGSPTGTDYMAEVISAAEGLIDGRPIVMFLDGCQVEAYSLAVEELRHRLTSRGRSD